MHYTTVGVTGHIDHGKTTLVGILTGTDTDTHPEEKRRGITIDLGFASMQEGDHTFAFIDAPGHQKYVGNLLAGVSAVDIGLLVVACDQGIQEQTLEHVGILRTLGVPQLLVALSRVDLVDASTKESVTEELEVFLSDFGFEEFPIVPVSSVTKEGIEELKNQLLEASTKVARPEDWRHECAFRMPIDRVLNVPGRGLVVAGTVWSGAVKLGDAVRVAGYDDEFRVREVEVHGENVSESRLGVRTALNLTGGSHATLRRGDELVACEGLELAEKIVVELELYPEAQPIKCPTTMQMHAGTAACSAKVIGPAELEPGQKTIAVVEPESRLLVTYDQPCLFRRPYPVGAVAGGRVVAFSTTSQTKNKSLLALGESLQSASGNLPHQITAWIEHSGQLQLSKFWCEQQLGSEFKDCQACIEELAPEKVTKIGEQLVSAELIARVEKHILRLLEVHSAEHDDTWVVTESILSRSSKIAATPILKIGLSQLLEKQRIVEMNGRLAVASEKTVLSKKQKGRMVQLLKQFESTRTPPSLKELTDTLSASSDAIVSLCRHAAHQGILIEFAKDQFIGSEVLEQLKSEVVAAFEEKAELSASEIKEHWGLSRKYAIPLLEYFDDHQFTMRQGDLRQAGKELKEPAGT